MSTCSCSVVNPWLRGSQRSNLLNPQVGNVRGSQALANLRSGHTYHAIRRELGDLRGGQPSHLGSCQRLELQFAKARYLGCFQTLLMFHLIT